MWRVRTVLKLTKVAPLVSTNNGVRSLRQLNLQEELFCLHTGVSQIAYRHMSSEPKRLCTENMTGMKIGTHNGTFHCDEVLACFFLRQLPEYKVCSRSIVWLSMALPEALAERLLLESMSVFTFTGLKCYKQKTTTTTTTCNLIHVVCNNAVLQPSILLGCINDQSRVI